MCGSVHPHLEEREHRVPPAFLAISRRNYQATQLGAVGRVALEHSARQHRIVSGEHVVEALGGKRRGWG
eukprot:scaffold33394_cov56-Isochrysis_galbana.AAC.1